MAVFWAANWLTPVAMAFLSTRESTPSSTCNLFYREGGKLWNVFQEKIQDLSKYVWLAVTAA